MDKPRPGRPAVIGLDQVEQVVVDTVESTPQNATHWSRSKIAERCGLSKSTVGRIWKASGLTPNLGKELVKPPRERPIAWSGGSSPNFW